VAALLAVRAARLRLPPPPPPPPYDSSLPLSLLGAARLEPRRCIDRDVRRRCTTVATTGGGVGGVGVVIGAAIGACTTDDDTDGCATADVRPGKRNTSFGGDAKVVFDVSSALVTLLSIAVAGRAILSLSGNVGLLLGDVASTTTLEFVSTFDCQYPIIESVTHTHKYYESQ
jgi:hypothetical protein